MPEKKTSRSFGIGRDVARLAAARTVKHVHRAFGDRGRPGPRVVRGVRQRRRELPRVPVRRQAQRAVVLLRSADVPRDVRGRHAVVELRGGKLLVGPVAAGGEADRAAAVVADHAVRRVVGIDPEVVEVAVGPVVDDFVRRAAVGREEERRVLHVDDIFVVMVREHVRVVERPLPDAPLVVDQLPALARVVTAEEPAVVVLEERVDPVRIRARDRQPDPPDDALLRHPRIARDLGPRGPRRRRF